MPLSRMSRGSALAAVLLLAGCAQTVNGVGSTGAHLGFPSSSVVPSGSVPTTPTAPLTTGGTAVTDVAAHLHVRLFGADQRRVDHLKINGETITDYTHAAHAVGTFEEAGSSVYSPPLPAAFDSGILLGAVNGFSGDTGFTLGSNTETTFRGHTARIATYSGIPGASEYTLLVVLWSSTRTYLFFAPSGAELTRLTTSFGPIG